MAKMYGVFRLGRDAEVRFTPSGKAVANLALAYNYGQAEAGNQRPTQWIEASIWDKRAEALAPYLLKGNQIGATISDVRIETYESAKGAGYKLVGRVDDVELISREVDKKPAQQVPVPQAPPAVDRQPAPAAIHAGSGFDDMDDDLQF
ncbi:Ssb Single-stranded DNA-binding protein [uncultured Caudovirales phage]|uniref:Ssb Single-stranded DNA-binding protein n=1 Tax=uncultured Caudovirales phage TaxID=2100421 RepID=A0A6J5LKP7_9CAUD|nr:Ssb Single-stranded DNA-binding protein [uncultured Caudovirales phage]